MAEEYTGTHDDDFARRISEISDDDAQKRAESLLAGLQEYDLEDEDADLLNAYGAGFDDDDVDDGPAPVLAIVGRPNVGKSSFVNRILGRREAVVEDVPGVTRDRVSYPAQWAGRKITLVDTGGWDIDSKGIASRIAEQAEVAVELADAVVLVVDVRTGVTATDEHIVRMLRRTKKPVLLAANKVDSDKDLLSAAELWSLGMGEPHPISAMHGNGVADLLDEVLKILPEQSQIDQAMERGGPRRVALVGRPNVGKSSLLNKIVGHKRVVVDNEAGTTRDPVDELVELGGRQWRFIDTAGIRKRSKNASGSEFYASLRTQTALERSEVAVVLLEASEVISDQDMKIIRNVIDAGRGLVVAFNKWDLLDDERRWNLEREIEREFGHIRWAPRVNISAESGRHVERLVPAMETALESWENRIPTGKLNAFLAELVAANPHPLRGGKQPRILFGTQAGSRPPKFVLFTTGFLDPGYRRFIERRLREVFDFEGTPIEISMRIREKRKKR
ncbi:ribosome biogenesis GTPase Der [Brevibacterium ravenspurgense]|uniref:GTPase Der n=1 Tax=Brevibacterium ravenspurgense TaxID=479117 RepID=A0A2I1IE69_9MICO|nr:ribosome biogenesis GTPase Der [Brevibacterium ravenspurgense]PKY69415.1 ribosome biogenesis GTPase Der [Brevibacterium ravenspurgense]